MMAVHELESFVAKFRYLCSAGYRASLSFNSDANGNAHVKFEVDLGFLEPPYAVPPPNSASPKKRSPGYYRRLQRRREEREHLNSSNIVNESISTSKPVVETGKVVKHDEMDVVIESACDSTAHVNAGDNSFKENDVDLEGNEEAISVADCENVKEVSVVDAKHDVDDDVQDTLDEYGSMCTIDDYGPRFPTNESVAREDPGMNVAQFDENLSAIDNLRNLTLSLDLIHRSRMSNTLQ